MDWNLFDYLVMGTMLLVAGGAAALAYRTAGRYRLLAYAAIAFAFLWLWAELAVGVFTTWGS